MKGFLLRTLVTALGLCLAQAIIPGISIQIPGTLIMAALLIGLVNALVRPLVVLFTLPITILSLGLFLIVINAAMLGLVAAMLNGFTISGFFAALFGWLIISATSTIASWYIGPNGRYKVMILKDQRPD